jgi:tetratricopeptide (TPR) repeat protein
MNRRERRAGARASQAKPPSPGADTPAAAYEAGLRHMRAGQYLDAQICCQQALAIDPGHAETLHLMGLLSLRSEQFDHAVEWISRALKQAPKAEYLYSLGTALRRQGRLEDALMAFDKAVQFKPDSAELWIGLGRVLGDLKRPADALLSFQHALKLNPRHCDAVLECGAAFCVLGRAEEALPYFRLCMELQPNHPATLTSLTRCLLGLKRLDEALVENQRAYAHDPGNADACDNLGIILERLGREDEALTWLDRALALRPDFIDTLNNRALVLGRLHRFDEGAAMYRRVETLDPDNAQAKLGLGLLHLLLGDFGAGWSRHVARFKMSSSADYPKFSEPMWQGEENIEGKTILIHVDEGLGDTIQFARYVPLVAARGARVILVVLDAVRPLLSGLSGVWKCLPFSAGALPPFDMHCPLSSLPMAFGTRLDTIPSEISYLPAPPAARVQVWQDRLGRHEKLHDKLRVGLVWSGNPQHGNDHNRSIPLRMLLPILDTDATFVSLQKDPRPEDRAVLQQRNDIVDLTAELTDFVETAALINCLDLVISVDTSVAHLAAALGRPTWILLPYAPDYRWLLDRDDSPWYPAARLFRQDKTRKYASVLDRVRSELEALIAARQGMRR